MVLLLYNNKLWDKKSILLLLHTTVLKNYIIQLVTTLFKVWFNLPEYICKVPNSSKKSIKYSGILSPITTEYYIQNELTLSTLLTAVVDKSTGNIYTCAVNIIPSWFLFFVFVVLTSSVTFTSNCHGCKFRFCVWECG